MRNCLLLLDDALRPDLPNAGRLKQKSLKTIPQIFPQTTSKNAIPFYRPHRYNSWPLGIETDSDPLSTIKKGVSQKTNSTTIWCLRPELNRHGGGPPRDFKSLASTNSATQAFLLSVICNS